MAELTRIPGQRCRRFVAPRRSSASGNRRKLGPKLTPSPTPRLESATRCDGLTLIPAWSMLQYRTATSATQG